VLDAIYYLSFCHSANNPVDSQVIRHGEELMMIEGKYSGGFFASEASLRAERKVEGGGRMDSALTISCGVKRGQKKHFKKDKKEYRRLSEHIGLIPVVTVAPSDTLLIEGGSEERRRLMDLVISQYDRSYIDALNRYNKALQQRNTMLKAEDEPNSDVISIWEEQMAIAGEQIYECRDVFVREMVPIFQRYYETISGNRERVAINYISHCQRGSLLEVIQRDRMKDRAVGYSLHGIHRDDLEFMIGDHLMKREGSQGQNKTFVISLKLAQFDFLKRTNSKTTPLLLLDDIFDKLDAKRVEQIVNLVAGDDFGQIFITDTNRDHLDQILSTSSHDYKIFYVEEGHVQERR
jgi:DNA replication and repair protein RecF